ncbi:hypothetical protein D3C87_1668010 [compost metagenome]
MLTANCQEEGGICTINEAVFALQGANAYATSLGRKYIKPIVVLCDVASCYDFFEVIGE